MIFEWRLDDDGGWYCLWFNALWDVADMDRFGETVRVRRRLKCGRKERQVLNGVDNDQNKEDEGASGCGQLCL